MKNQPESKMTLAVTTPSPAFRKKKCLRPRLPLILAGCAILAATFAPAAHAGGESKVFGSQFAWNNNFNNSVINATFGSGSTPSITVSFNFSSFNLYGYPACLRGWHYGFNPANDNLFPMQVSAATSIPCTFSYSQSGQNMAGDFAYDMFLRWDNQKSTPQLEIMVWAGNNSWPIGTQTGTSVISAGGWTFDLWEGMNTAAGYYVYTFIPHGTAGQANLPTSGSINVDMKVFFNWLQANKSGDGRYNNSMFLDVIEAGLEITRGNGSATMTANFNATTGGGGTTYYKLQNRATSLCVDGMGRTSNGSNCGQYASGGSFNQQWAITTTSGFVKLQNRGTGLFLDGMGRTSNGSAAGQWGSSSSFNQQWTQSTTSGFFKYQNRATGLFIDGMGRTSNGSDLGQWASSSSFNQQFSRLQQ
jgi:Glycosyl hydrolase family 12/Ricin-type beta-trefoil lectin domain-like